MNSKKWTVWTVVAIVATFFVLGMYAYQSRVQSAQDQKINQENTRLVRPHSPVFGPSDAPVTVVEFFDPACESCRAIYPTVKALLKRYPTEVRVVLRYAPFHKNSDLVVRLLEAAKLQNLYLPVLEKVLEEQPLWADHGQPNLGRAYESAASVGLDMVRARQDAQTPAVDAVLEQDIADLTALEVTRTPTFIVNGRALMSFGPEPLAALVAEEVAKTQR